MTDVAAASCSMSDCVGVEGERPRWEARQQRHAAGFKRAAHGRLALSRRRVSKPAASTSPYLLDELRSGQEMWRRICIDVCGPRSDGWGQPQLLRSVRYA
jgi:hypothetical protein